MARKSWSLLGVVILFALAASNMVAQPAAKGKGGFKSPVLSALTYSADPFPLIAHDEIVKDLKLDAKQKDALRKALAEYHEVVPSAPGAGKKGVVTAAKRQEAAKKLETAVRATLGDKVKRLEQISIQGAGLAAFFNGARGNDQLKLSEEQIAKGKEILEASYKELVQKNGGRMTLAGAKGAEKRSAFADVATPKLLGLLSNDQNKRWLELAGDPVQPEVLLKVRTSVATGFAGFEPAPGGFKGKGKLVGPATAPAQLAQGQSDLAAGYYASAEILAQKALDLAKEPNLLRADCQTVLGAARCKLNRPADAQKPLEDALALYGKLVGPYNPRIARTLTWLGVCAELRGKLDDAEKLQRQALDIHEKVEGPRSLQAADNWTNLGSIAVAKKKLDDAEKHHRQALEIREKSAQRDDRLVALSLYHLGVVYRAAGKAKEAETHVLSALQMYRGINQNHVDLIPAVRMLTELCVAQKRWPDAEKHAREWLRVVEKAPLDRSAQLDPLERLSTILTALDRRDEAAAVTQRRNELRDKLAAQKTPMP